MANDKIELWLSWLFSLALAVGIGACSVPSDSPPLIQLDPGEFNPDISASGGTGVIDMESGTGHQSSEETQGMDESEGMESTMSETMGDTMSETMSETEDSAAETSVDEESGAGTMETTGDDASEMSETESMTSTSEDETTGESGTGDDSMVTSDGADDQGTDSESTTTGPVVQCEAGETRAGPTSCGFNAKGKLDQECVEGRWSDTEQCQDPDACENGTTQPGTEPCGLDNTGFFEQFCSKGQWIDTARCGGPTSAAGTKPATVLPRVASTVGAC